MAALKGRRVAIGQLGSASRTTALRVLEAHGLGVKDITPLELPLGDALVALRQKKADAFIQVIGVPADSIRDARHASQGLIRVPGRVDCARRIPAHEARECTCRSTSRNRASRSCTR